MDGLSGSVAAPQAARCWQEEREAREPVLLAVNPVPRRTGPYRTGPDRMENVPHRTRNGTDRYRLYSWASLSQLLLHLAEPFGHKLVNTSAGDIRGTLTLKVSHGTSLDVSCPAAPREEERNKE